MNLYMMITGGGTEAISMLTKYGGASSFFRGAIVPYSSEELEECIGQFDKAVSKETCRSMLDYCDITLSEYSGDKISIACTAKLAKENEREGRENYAIVGHSVNGEKNFFKLSFEPYNFMGDKDVFKRPKQEQMLAQSIVKIFNNDMSGAFGVTVCSI